MYNPKITRKIFPIGKYSYALTLPKDLIKLLGWQSGELLEVVPDLRNKRVVIKKFRF